MEKNALGHFAVMTSGHFMFVIRIPKSTVLTVFRLLPMPSSGMHWTCIDSLKSIKAWTFKPTLSGTKIRLNSFENMYECNPLF